LKKYRKRPIVVEAEQWTGDVEKMKEFVGDKADFEGDAYLVGPIEDALGSTKMFIHTLEGTMEASMGDFVIKGAKGEFYPCKRDIFLLTYSVVDDEDQDDPYAN